MACCGGPEFDRHVVGSALEVGFEALWDGIDGTADNWSCQKSKGCDSRRSKGVEKHDEGVEQGVVARTVLGKEGRY
jgi:hypothetical protein